MTDSPRDSVLVAADAAELLAILRDGIPRTRAQLAEGIVQLIAWLPVYRTYIESGALAPHEDDRAALERAFAAAGEVALIRAPLLALLHEIFLGPPSPLGGKQLAARDAFVLRFQQESGPATAKGIEDTALYRYSPLLSLCEVGADPAGELGDAVGYLHDANIERSVRWPGTMLATSTHDTKRSADVRARLDVLSEIPSEWARQLAAWSRANRDLRARVQDRIAPDAQMEYVIYQTLVGMWPATGAAESERGELRERASAFARKAAREAKARTSWIDINEEYERALASFMDALFSRPEFVRELESFVARIAPSGELNAIARTVLHLTSPGFPDIYQGDELWNFSLVDPDNRRPVSYESRRAALAGLGVVSPLGDIPESIEINWVRRADRDTTKLEIIRDCLRARAAHAALFAHGSYQPLAADGPRGANIFAFARRAAASGPDNAAVIVVPRLTHAFAPTAPPLGDLWRDTDLHLPAILAATRWRCAISHREIVFPPAAGPTDPGIRVPLTTILAASPVALLLPVSAGGAQP